MDQELTVRGLSLRAADLKTGVSYNTISRMTMGYVPEMETVVKFAFGLGLNVNEWLTKAGYPPVEPQPPSTPAEIVAQGLAAIRRAHPHLDVRDPGPEQIEGLTESGAHQLVAFYWQLVEEGGIPLVDAPADWKPAGAVVPEFPASES